jgi:hypothetical protein
MSRKSESRELLAAGWGHRRAGGAAGLRCACPFFRACATPATGRRLDTKYGRIYVICCQDAVATVVALDRNEQQTTFTFSSNFLATRTRNGRRRRPATHPCRRQTAPPAPQAPLRRARRRPAPPGVPKNGRDGARYTRRCPFGSAGFSPVNSASRAALATPSVPARSIACCSVPPASSTATPS